jgi:hypothetical protein
VDAEAEGGHLVKEADFEAEKREKSKKLANFAFMCYGSFPKRNALKLTFVCFQLQLFSPCNVLKTDKC